MKTQNHNKSSVESGLCINLGVWSFPYTWSFTSIIVHKVETSWVSVYGILVVVGVVWVPKWSLPRHALHTQNL